MEQWMKSHTMDMPLEIPIYFIFSILIDRYLFGFLVLLSHGLFVVLGLVDTAVKTAETGYMQRRLVKVNDFFFSLHELLPSVYKVTRLIGLKNLRHFLKR